MGMVAKMTARAFRTRDSARQTASPWGSTACRVWPAASSKTGTKCLLVSHGSVDDKSTGELMVSMFGQIGGGSTRRAIAPQQAIRKAKAQTRFLAPRLRAPFGRLGERQGR